MTNRNVVNVAILAVASISMLACGPHVELDPPELDAEASSFLRPGKADTGAVTPGSAGASAVLHVANTASLEVLVSPPPNGVYLAHVAADNIVAFRLGDDGLPGSMDDGYFDTLAELDAVPFIGPVAFGRLLDYAQAQGLVGSAASDGGVDGGGDGGWVDPPVTGCSAFCGTQSPAGCWCDDACVANNDCCADHGVYCGAGQDAGNPWAYDGGPYVYDGGTPVYDYDGGTATYDAGQPWDYDGGIPSMGDAGAAASCADWTLGFGEGSTPFVTAGAANDFAPSCGGSAGLDVAIAWTAPSTGRYRFDTFGTLYDTVLAVYAGCGGAELACNDDTSGLQSQVTFDAIAGTTYIIVVDAYGSISGDNLTLRVAPVL